jgi:4-hydroxythreonine-4-phosphate dehydrogenase
MMMLPTIAMSIGDPAGIGPEVVVKALADDSALTLARWLVVGTRAVVSDAESLTGLKVLRPGSISLVDLKVPPTGTVRAGELSAASGRAALQYVREATRLCLAGQADGMVTAPLNKEAVTMTGERFSGHTEFIAELCGVSEPRMMLINERLRVVHVSTHVPLRTACQLDPQRILRTIQLGSKALQELGIERPLVAVCGLNPHAGENGLFGTEDSEYVLPAVRVAQSQGIECSGPSPADTLFLKAARGQYDLVVAMYHDQGHIPMKLLDFEHTVNVTLGLPIIRTSVDHGTAFDIAGKNQADPASMISAMKLAAQMAVNRAAAQVSEHAG